VARAEAVAVGLYYRTPDHLLPAACGLLSVRADEPKEQRAVVCDPCAGEGVALAAVCASLAAQVPGLAVGAYACELEATRFRATKRAVEWTYRGGVAHGDAFCLRAPPTPGAGVLFDNPPYHDREPGADGRLEVRFVRRTLPLLAVGGVLLLLVPHYSLADMVDPLARELEDVRCFRFPDDDFAVFKQVLLVGRRRRALSVDDAGIAARLRSWSTSPEACEPWSALDGAAGTYEAPTLPRHEAPFASWEVAALDLDALAAQAGPWRRTARGGRVETLSSVYPQASGLALLRRRYPVVSPLKPAYLAAAVACGLFDGEAVRPDDAASGLPEVLVRGVFTRDFVAVDERVSEEGEVVGEVQVQRPKLEVTVLDLSSGAYVPLASRAELTGSTSLAGMTVADFLQAYARDLLAVVARNCPVLHDPARDEAFPLPALERPLYPAQADAVRAAVKLVSREHAHTRLAWCGEDRPPPVPLSLAEVGSGKTSCALTIAAAVGARDLLVLCPPHLVAKNWPDEVRKVLGARAETLTLDSTDALDRYAARARAPDRPEYLVGVLSREAAKLSYARESVTGACPRCGVELPPGDLAGKRARCRATTRTPAVDPETGRTCRAARLALALAGALARAYPDNAGVLQYLPPRRARGRAKLPESSAARAAMPALCARACELVSSGTDPRVAAHLAMASRGAPLLVEALLAAFEARPVGAYGWEVAGFLRDAACLVPEARRGEVVEAMGLREHDRPPDFAAVDRARAERAEYGALSFALDHPSLGKLVVGSLRHALKALDLLGAEARWDDSPECGEPLWQASPRLGRRVALADWVVRKHPRLFQFFILDECFPAGTRVSGRPIEDVRPGDLVDAFDERTGRVERRAVRRLFVSRPRMMVRVWVGGVPVVCTAGHPFFTARGWVPALDLGGELVLSMSDGRETVAGPLRDVRRAGDGEDEARSAEQRAAWVRVLQRAVPEGGIEEAVVHLAHGQDAGGGRRGVVRGVRHVGQARDPEREVHAQEAGALVLPGPEVLACPAEAGHVRRHAADDGAGASEGRGPHEGAEPDARPSGARAGEHQAPRSRAEGARRERPTAARGAVTPRDEARLAHGGRGLAREEASGLPDLLQARPRARGPEGGGRGGRRLPQLARPSGARPQERRVLAWARVDRVEVLEPTGDGTFGGVCPDGLVYNLEVEGLHTYVADGFVVHNCQEHSDRDASQTIASTKLMARVGRGVALSGSACSGYAESLFAGTYARDPRFRERFGRGDTAEFVRQYGYLKRVVEDRDRESGKVVAFGASSDRVIRSHRVTGQAPGVLPVFLLDHLLRSAVPLHKADLALSLPAHREEHVRVELDGVLAERLAYLTEKLVDEVKASRYKKGRAGKLWGALGELVAFPDVCTDDVCPGGAYEVRYPPEVEEGARRPSTKRARRELVPGELVCSVPTLPASTVLPKERAMLERLERELSAGSRVLVYPRHVELMPRLQRLIERELGVECAALYASRPEGLDGAHGRERVAGGGRGAGDDERGRGTGANRRAQRREQVPGHGDHAGDAAGTDRVGVVGDQAHDQEDKHGERRDACDRRPDGVRGDRAPRRVGEARAARHADVGAAAAAPPIQGIGSTRVRPVGAHERQAWIESEVVARGVRVLVVNPVAVKTGLNVLTYFNAAWWHENPGCDAVVCRQANGRIDRIGKTRETTAIYATAGALQEKAHKLWMHKVAASLAADGLDAGSAMALAGLGEVDGLDALGVARQLFAMIERDQA
jgi:hypothetical protein